MTLTALSFVKFWLPSETELFSLFFPVEGHRAPFSRYQKRLASMPACEGQVKNGSRLWHSDSRKPEQAPHSRFCWAEPHERLGKWHRSGRKNM